MRRQYRGGGEEGSVTWSQGGEEKEETGRVLSDVEEDDHEVGHKSYFLPRIF